MGSGEQPRHEVHSADGHAGAKDDAGEEALAAAFSEGEGDASDGDEAEAAGNGTGEAGRERVDGGLPRRGALSEARGGKQEDGARGEGCCAP